jgi:environmental stress-induced protein Ves
MLLDALGINVDGSLFDELVRTVDLNGNGQQLHSMAHMHHTCLDINYIAFVADSAADAMLILCL